MQRLIRCSSLIALAGLLAASGAGCCCEFTKQGFVVYSGWSVTFRRQPCCGGCADGGCVCSDQPTVAEAGQAGRSGRAQAEPGPLVAGPGHFHPVPTRPVFGPRPDLMAVPVSAPAQGPSGSMPDPEDVPVPGDIRPDDPESSADGAAPRPLRVQASAYSAGCKSCR